MKKILISLFSAGLVALCFSGIASAATLSSLDYYIIRQQTYEMDGLDTAPSATSDAGDEIIQKSSGSLTYEATDLVLPGKGGLDFVIKRTSAKGINLNARNHVQSAASITAQKDGGRKYVIKYYLNGNEDSPIYIAYDAIDQMLQRENRTNSIQVASDYTSNTRTLNTDGYTLISIKSPKAFPFSNDTAYYLASELPTGTSVTLQRDMNVGAVSIYYWNNTLYDYNSTVRIPPNKLAYGWSYNMPELAYVIISDEQVLSEPYKNKRLEIGMGSFYDSYTGKTLDIETKKYYDNTTSGDNVLSASATIFTWSSDNTPVRVPSQMYTIEIPTLGRVQAGSSMSSHKDTSTYKITRYDGMEFHFKGYTNGGNNFTKIRDKFGNEITRNGRTYTDTYGRKIFFDNDFPSVGSNDEIVKVKVNGEYLIEYESYVINDTVVDPNDLFGMDDKDILKVRKKVQNDTFKEIVYECRPVSEPIVIGSKSNSNPIEQVLDNGRDIIDKIILPAGGEIRYSYDFAREVSPLQTSVASYLHRLVSREEWLSSTDTTPINKENYAYDRTNIAERKTTTTKQGGSGWSLLETFNKNGYSTKSVEAGTEAGNQYHITNDYTYVSTSEGNFLPATAVTSTRATSGGSAQTVTMAYAYNNKQQPVSVSRDGTVIETWEYSANAPYLPLQHFQRRASEAWIGTVNALSSDGKTVEYEYVAEKSSQTGTPTQHESTQYSYNSAGDVTQIIEKGVTVNYAYSYPSPTSSDLAGISLILTKTIPGVSNITNATGLGNSTASLVSSEKYDILGRVVEETNANGNATEHEYDLLGREIGATYADGTESSAQYDDAENYVIITDTSGTQKKHVFDPLGRNIDGHIYNASTSVWVQLYENTFDNQSRRTAQRVYDENGTEKVRIESEYYSDSALKAEKEYQGTTMLSKREYQNAPYNDATTSKTTVKAYMTPVNSYTVNQYANKYGHKTKGELVYGSTTQSETYTTDEMGNITAVKDFKANAESYSGNTESYLYDYANRIIKTITPYGYAETTIDSVGRAASEIDANGNTTAYTYDNAGRVIEISSPVSGSVKKYYDKNGNLTREETKNSSDHYAAVRNVYDSMNRVTDVVTNPSIDGEASTAVVHYTYDVAGNVTQVAEGLTALGQAVNASTHRVTNYTFDYLGNPQTMTYPMGEQESYGYNILGEKTWMTDANGSTTTYTYNGMGKVKTITAGSGANAQNIAYTYDLLGQVISMADDAGTTAYTYNARGDLLEEARGGVTKTYTYDANGNRKTFGVSNIPELSAVYTYDWSNRLTQVISGGDTTAYTYDAVGNMTGETTANGTTVIKSADFTYNARNLLTNQTNKALGVTLDTYARAYSPDGNVILVNNSGVPNNYLYDDVGSLLTDGVGGMNFGYNVYGNREKEQKIGSSTQTSVFNKNNQLIQEPGELFIGNGMTFVGNPTTYTYDDNGNQTTKSDGLTTGYTYDILNRLTEIKEASIEKITYSYDGNGLMQSKTDVETDTTTQFIYDGANIVAEVTNGVTTAYVRGVRLISMDNGEDKLYYHHNPHGDVEKLTNASGETIEEYTYDAYGNQRVSIGTLNPFRYCGEYWDGPKTVSETTVGETVYVSDMAWISSSNGWGPVMRDHAHSGWDGNNLTPITLGGQEYTKGIGAHAESEIQVSLGGDYESFHVIVGADDVAGQWSNIVFKIYGDGELLFESPQMLPGDTPIPVNLDVSDVDILKLYADPGVHPNDDYADWADAKLIKKATDTSNITYISEMSWLSSSNGWGPIMRDYAHSGVNGTNLTPITLGGQEYAKGVGAHAESEIQVALDGEYETFKAIVGADDIAGQWANVVFKVYGDDELLFESPQMLPGNTPVSIDIDVSGVDILTLYADPGTYPNDDYADWADARLEKSTSSTTSPPSSTTVTTYGSGLIYLRARWYDPSIGRFISTDPYWNANNMIYGNNGNGGIPSLNAIRQSNNRYVYALNNPLRYKDSTGRVVTDWDRGHLTASELSRLQAITNSWSSGTASQQNAWRTEAYNMRVKYLTQGEYITSDGYVKSNVLKPISSTPTIVAPIKQSDVPPSSSGYNPPKGGPKKDNETHGWVDNNGNIWVPDKSGHGGDHWDVQYPNGGYDNVYPDGSIRAGAGGRGKFSPSITIDKAAIGTSSIIAAGAYVVYQGTQWVVQQVLPYALVLAPLGI